MCSRIFLVFQTFYKSIYDRNKETSSGLPAYAAVEDVFGKEKSWHGLKIVSDPKLMAM